MASKRRAICLVIDGCGIGAMHDVPKVKPEDRGANTLLHIAQATGPLDLPVLNSLGLGNVADVPGLTDSGSLALASYGRSCLMHYGADTYMGHQELMGTIPSRPTRQLMRDVASQVAMSLEKAGYRVRELRPGLPVLVVNERAVVADNIEAQAGLNINVTASLVDIDFEPLCEIGEKVREVVDVSRVIVVAGRGFTFRDMERHVKIRSGGQVGVDTPALGVYDESYRVRHLGKDVDVEKQVPSIVKAFGLPVALIGKAADVIQCKLPDFRDPVIPTKDVFRRLVEAIDLFEEGLIIANVQESDLAGHEEDPVRWRQVLEEVDCSLARVLDRLTGRDMLIVTADHGNDPSIGHSQHTREMTPILVYVPGRPAHDLGVRSTLADIGATLSDHLGLPMPRDGTSMVGTERRDTA